MSNLVRCGTGTDAVRINRVRCGGGPPGREAATLRQLRPAQPWVSAPTLRVRGSRRQRAAGGGGFPSERHADDLCGCTGVRTNEGNTHNVYHK
jgi:hypothetical protein